MSEAQSYADLISEDLYIDGWRAGSSERSATTSNPFNDEPSVRLPRKMSMRPTKQQRRLSVNGPLSHRRNAATS